MLLRIVTWNCAMALHRKHERLLALRPDIAIVPECAEPDVLRRKAPGFAFSDCEWVGTNPQKGLGVFAFGDLRLRLHQSWERGFRHFLPVEVRGPAVQVNLLALCAFSDAPVEKVVPNPRTTGAALAHYSPFLRAAPAVVAGDFNASARFDAAGGHSSFAALDASLRDLGLVSAYHAATGHAFDAEPHPTLFWKWQETQPFHIDYVYVPDAWVPRIRSVVVGSAADWLATGASDHAPVVVECDVPDHVTPSGSHR